MPKGKKKDYDPVNLDLALREVQASDKPKIREIARKYNVPKSTLHFRIKNPEHKTSFGPRPVLTEEEESVLVIWIKRLMRKGFPLKIENLQQSVSKFLLQNPRPNPFKDNYPGGGWVKAFLKRHPDIVPRTSEGVTQSSACVSENDIRKWFTEIRQYLAESNLLDVIAEPSRVFNGDESGFQLCPKTGKVLAVKGTKNVYNIDSNNSKESITVMFTFSASGEACPPMVVYNYQRIPQKVAEGIPKEWGVGRSDNGWMTSELFFEYVANVFYPYLLKKGITLPVIYFLDGHKTHLTYDVSKLCKELRIEVIALYPNATRILQPADVAVFRPVKAAWKDAARTWLMNNPGETITKVNFAGILEEALEKSIKPETLINGFRACGLVPFNPDAIDYDKCLGSINNAQVEIQQKQLNVLTLSQFKEIVGPSKLTELDAFKDTENNDDNLQILYQLYKSFLDLPPSLEERRIPVTNPSILELDASPPALDNEPFVDDFVPVEYPQLFPNNNSLTTETTTRELYFPTYITPVKEISQTVNKTNFTENKNLIAETTTQALYFPTNVTPVKETSKTVDKTNITETYNNKLITETTTQALYFPTNVTPVKETSQTVDKTNVTETYNNKLITETTTQELYFPTDVTPAKETSQTFDKTNVTETCSIEKSPAFKIISNSNFAPFLAMPKTPERKGKRNTVRFPYAITSEKYRNMFKEQKEKKDSELKMKEERKKVREEMKLKKEIDIKKKKSKPNVAKKYSEPKASTNTCKMCSKVTKTSNRLICDMCSSIFHLKCVPSKHQQHVPEDITSDLFVCHVCYVEDNNEDSVMDIEDTEIENDNDDEDSEANMLFEMFKQQKNQRF